MKYDISNDTFTLIENIFIDFVLYNQRLLIYHILQLS